VSILEGKKRHYTPQLGGMAAQTFSLANMQILRRPRGNLANDPAGHIIRLLENTT
jgi:hypothetical protein